MVNEILIQLNSIIKANEEKLDGHEMYGSLLTVINIYVLECIYMLYVCRLSSH